LHLSSPCTCYMPYPSHSPWIYQHNNIWWRVQIMEFLITQFYRASCHFVPLRSKYSPKSLSSNTFNLCSSLNARGQVSHPYRTTGKIIVYILIFRLLHSRHKDKKDSELHGRKHYPNLICS
jgi:putative component of membrane protein insertase Oxa1/YidC/SpoIIIJ protein YidD